ncbi:MAG: helix-hairpin-helix domain-containing protein, partial [Lachnospiraceae bacterium]|nr:helix-hairpin-helix domain-containing protein [Lachnospiraceae bacterium]
ALNLAEIVTDGSKIMVPKKGALVDEGMSVAEDSSTSDLININTADVKELTTLAGIGEARAEAIIEYREQHGGFSKIEDIMNVSGIKEAMFSRIKDDISV